MDNIGGTRAPYNGCTHELMNIRGGVVGLLILLSASGFTRTLQNFWPGGRVLVDAHNAYPEHGRHQDRIFRALSTGVPIAIEQDLVWCRSTAGIFDVVVAHDAECRGGQPTLRQYFFDSVKPIVETALAEGHKDQWPVITLNLDFKMDRPELHRAVWALLGEYEAWLTTGRRTATPATLAPLDVGPILVLTGQADTQEVIFHDSVPIGDRLRLFGAVRDMPPAAGASADVIPRPTPATNYRRWWNHPWTVVEPEGQTAAGTWTAADNARLTALVTAARDAGLWIRFYTLNGIAAAESAGQGWSATYNFGSLETATLRWLAARDAGVDFIATDQYEGLARALHRQAAWP
jgi:hypothetical protein